MLTDAELLERIKALVDMGSFRLRSHAARHVIEEGFTEDNIVEAVMEKVASWKTIHLNRAV